MRNSQKKKTNAEPYQIITRAAAKRQGCTIKNDLKDSVKPKRRLSQPARRFTEVDIDDLIPTHVTKRCRTTVKNPLGNSGQKELRQLPDPQDSVKPNRRVSQPARRYTEVDIDDLIPTHVIKRCHFTVKNPSRNSDQNKLRQSPHPHRYTEEDGYEIMTRAAAKRRNSTVDQNSVNSKNIINISTSPQADGLKKCPKNSSNILQNKPLISQIITQGLDIPLIDRNITPSNLTFGVLGLGNMGAMIAKALVCTGHEVVVWNRTVSKCILFSHAGATVMPWPRDVVRAADIIFSCVDSPNNTKDMVFGRGGFLRFKDFNNKAYVEMSSVHPDIAESTAQSIQKHNGRYLSIQMQGTLQEIENGEILIFSSGDEMVFTDCNSCFRTWSRDTIFFGAEVGMACKIKLIMETIANVSLVGLSEAMCMADQFKIPLTDIMKIVTKTSMNSKMLLDKGKAIAAGFFRPQQTVSSSQKNLRNVLNVANDFEEPLTMPVTAATNQVFEHTKAYGFANSDTSAIYIASRF